MCPGTPGKEPAVARSSPAALAGCLCHSGGEGGLSSASTRPSAEGTTAVGHHANLPAWGLV